MDNNNNICVFGTGYVGLVTGACLSIHNNVICVDIDKNKIKRLQNGIIDIYEPQLNKIINKSIKNNRLTFSDNSEQALHDSDICFICVGTPMNEDGSSDLKSVETLSHFIGKTINHHMYIIQKSTVPIGTNEKVKRIINDEIKRRNEEISFDIISNPEFLSEGTAVEDFLHPARVIAGVENKQSQDIIYNLYLPYVKDKKLIIAMDIKSAELTKYASNSILASKVSFINELSQICELTGANINLVSEGMRKDPRIGNRFLNASCGYGGSCFPKDIKSLIYSLKEYNYYPRMLNAIQDVNESQKTNFINRIFTRFNNDVSNLTFALWGLTFKPDTNDTRCSASITIIEKLLQNKAKVKAFDPKGFIDINGLTLTKTKYEALKNADALIIATDWEEFYKADLSKIKKYLKKPIIFDGRNMFNHTNMTEYGFEYYQIGVNNPIK